MNQNVQENSKKRDSSAWMTSQLLVLHEITKEMQSELDLPKLLNLISQLAAKLLGGDAAGILLLDEERKHLTFKGAYGLDREIVQQTRDVVGESIAGRVVKSGKPIIANDLPADARFYNPAAEGSGLLALVSTPLQVRGEIIGTLDVHSKRKRAAFSEDDLRILSLMATQAAVAIQNAELAINQTKLLEQVSKARNTAKVVAEVTTLENIDNTLQFVANGTQDALNCDVVTLYGYDQHKDRINYPPTMVGVRYPDRASRRVDFVPNYIVFQILQRDQPYIAEDISTDPLFKKRRFAQDEQISSCVAIPLKVGPEKVGVMFVNYRTAHHFTQDELANIDLFANQAAIAIHNANLFQEREHRARQMEAIAEISRTINTSLDLYMALNAILDSIKSLIDYVAAEICLWYEERGAMVVVDQAGDPRFTEHVQGVYHLDEGYTGWIARHWQPLLIEDSLACNNEQPQIHNPDKSICSFLGVPLQAGNDRFGVLQLISDIPHAFDQDDERLLSVIGQHAIIAIKNARLFEAEQSRAAYLAAVHRVAVATSSTLDSSEIFRRALVEMLDVLKLDQGDVILFDRVGGYGYTLIEDAKRFQSQEPNVSIPLQDNVAIDWILTNKLPLVIDDVVNDARLDSIRQAIGQGARSMLLIPVLIKNEVIGCINLYASTRRKFVGREVELAQTMTSQMATAIENAQFYEQAEKQVSVLNTLHEAGRVVTSSLELDEILNLIVEQAWNLTIYQGKKISFASISLLEDAKLNVVATYPREQLSKTEAILEKEIDLSTGGDTQIGIIGRVIRTGVSQLVGDVNGDPDYLQTHSETCSELAVPIKIGDAVTGVINVEHPHPNAFDRGDQYALESLAAHAAIAIQNAQLFETEQRRLEHLSTVHRVSVAASSTLNMDKILHQAVAEMVWAFLGVDQGEAILFNLQDNHGRIVAEYPHTDKANKSVSLAEDAAVGWILAHREPLAIESVPFDPRLDNIGWIVDRWGVQSILLTPLLVSDEVIGIINLYTIHTPRQFTAEEIELAQTMANQVAVVIKNLQSQEEVSAVQTVNSAFMLLSRWAHKVRQKSFALRKDLDSLKKDLPMGLFDDMLDRMSESIQELSLPTQILAGGAEDSPEQLVDLAQLLREVATRLCGRHRTVPIELALKIDDVPRAIKGNQLFLEIALEMLIENAVESIEQKGEPGLLEARCYLLNDTVTAQIRDSGSGIPTEIEENLFRGRVTSKKGFGYGSFTAANILRAHKGDIQVVETGPAGTVIEFYLPASQTGGKHNE